MNIIKKAVILLLAALTALTALTFTACKEDPIDAMNPVVLQIGKYELRRFYFDSLYATNSKYSEFAAGRLSQSDYFDVVAAATERYAVTLKTAKEQGFTLTEEDEASVRSDSDKQWDHIREVFLERVDSNITDPAKIEEEFERLFTIDTGYSSEVYRACLDESLRNRLLIKKLFDKVTDGIEPTEQDIRSYLDLQSNIAYTEGFGGFRYRFEQYRDNGGEPFVFVADDCFTVIQYLIAPGDGAQAEADALDARLEAGITADEFRELVASENNGDENMRGEMFRKLGYLVHESVIGDYSNEFTYAAYLASGSKVFPGMTPDFSAEFGLFETTDGKTVAKVAGEDGIHYVMLARKYLKGNLSYTEGDPVWQLGYEGAALTVRQAYFDKQVDEWLKDAKIEWFYDRFKDDYMPHQTED